MTGVPDRPAASGEATLPDKADAVVVGGGLSGLACALRLALSGRSVVLFEAHDRVGGLNSWFRRGRRELSTGLHAFTNYLPPESDAPISAPFHRLLRQLRIKRAQLRLAPQRGSSIRFPSATLRFDNHPGTLRDQVAAVFPGDIDGFDRLVRHIADTDEAADDLVPDTARNRLRRFLREPLLVDMLCAPVFYYGNPREGDMDWLAFCVIWKSMFSSGLAYPEGGIRPLLELLVARTEAEGGLIRTGTAVAAILTRGGKAVGVRLASGWEVAADTVFSCAGRNETRRLLAAAASSGTTTGEALDEVSRITVMELLVALSVKPAEAGFADSVMFWSAKDSFDFSRPEGLSGAAHGVLASPDNYAFPGDSGETPGEGLVRISTLANYGAWRKLLGAETSPRAAPERRDSYRGAKEAAKAAMLAEVRDATGLDFAARMTWSDLATPLTLARYTGHDQGALYGSVVKDRRGRCDGVDALFLIGADQGFHGIVGALLSGVAMANRIIAG